MRTPEQQAAFEAVCRMDKTLFLSTQASVMFMALRALIANSPDPAKLQMDFNQLMGQMQAYPGAAEDADASLVMRDLAKTLFRPPVSLET